MARVFLSNETYNAATSGAQVFGAAGTEQVNIFSGTTGVSVASSVERVDLSGNIADYTFSSFGAAMTIRDTAGNIVATVSDSGGKSVVFADGALSAAYAGTTLSLGGVALTGTAAAITPAAADIDATTTSDAAGSTTGGTTGGAAQSFTLTTGADVFNGGSGNDTFTAASGTLQTGDALLDGTSTDNDSLTAVLAANNQAPTISGIENITIDLDVFAGANATLNANNISGGTITLFSDTLGFNGQAFVDNAGSVNYSAGSNVTSLDLDGYEGGLVTAGSADTLTITPNAATDNVSLSVSGDVSAKIDAASNDWTINATAASTVDAVDSTAPTGTVTATGSANLTLTDSNAANAFSGVAIADNMTSGTLTVDVAVAGAVDGSDWAVDNVNVSVDLANTLTVRNGQLVTLEVDQADIVITGQNAATGTVTVNTGVDQTSVTFATLGTATYNVTAADTTVAELDAGTTDVTINVVGDTTFTKLTATDTDVTVTGTGDVTVDNANDTDADSVDASGLTGALDLDNNLAADDVTVSGGTGDNVVDFTGNTAATKTATYIGQSGDDTVTSATKSGNVAVTLAGGTNSITANTLEDGTLSVTGGAGAETVSATKLTTGTVAANLGGGDDTVTLGDSNIGAATIAINFGDGDDTLVFAAAEDLSTANFSVSGLETLTIADDTTFAGAQLDGGSFEVSSSVAGKAVTVTATAGGTTDLSGIVFNNEVGTNVAATINGGAGAETIIGGSGPETIDGKGGADVLTGGAGADTFVYAAPADSTATVTDLITDFVGGTDEIKFAAANNYNDLSDSDFSGSANLTAAATAALLADNATNNNNAQVDAILFEFGGSSYFLIQAAGDSAAYNAVADLIVEVTGLSGTVVATDFVA